nr:mitochondrial intermembrane space import and assembly protein 40 [Quercus suber]
MYRPAPRLVTGLRALPRTIPSRRFISTQPPHKLSRSWKSSIARWGAAGALVYYYNTSNVFADEPAYSIHSPPETTRENETFETLDAVAQQRKAAQARAQAREPRSSPSPSAADTTAVTGEVAAASPEELEAEAGQQGAFNEETGEINWDCPCLGGMADGPCGEQFKAAFSCFVYSKEEPKGVDCIEHFKTMQNCFREHPEIYGSELDEDEVEGQLDGQGAGSELRGESEPAPAPVSSSIQSTERSSDKNAPPGESHHLTAQKENRYESAKQAGKGDGETASEPDTAVPRAAHDAR